MENENLLGNTDSSKETQVTKASTNKSYKFKLGILAVLFAFLFACGLATGLGILLSQKYAQVTKPTLILISMDGFRFSYPSAEKTPNMIELAKLGVKAPAMKPVFPSKTFPNHYSIITGLYPESHGIVSNTFYDSTLNATFRISDPNAVTNPLFWGGEPFWNTLEFNKIKTACCFWPGSEAPIQGIQPTYWLTYDGNFPNEDRVDQVLTWLALPLEDRPNFITLYFSIADDYGHAYGPSSPRMDESLEILDQMVKRLVDGLKEMSLFDKVNIIITADHGMTDTSKDRVFLLDDYISLSDVQVIDYGPLCTMNPVSGKEEAVFQALAKASQSLNFKVYQRDGPNFPPERYHYSENDRIPKIIVECEGGYLMSNRASYNRNPNSFNGGNHGYDNLFPDMGATFIAQGPEFQSGETISEFINIEMYNMLANIFGVTPAPNNGTLDSTLIKEALRSPSLNEKRTSFTKKYFPFL